MNNLIIGLVGLPASGKSSVAEFLGKKGFKTVILSAFIKKALKKEGLAINRKNLQDMGDRLRKTKGTGILARLALTEIKNNKIKKAVIDGIRNLAEIKELQKQENFYLLGISATPDKRFLRLTKNKEAGKKLTTWEDFVADEIREDAGLKDQSGQQNRLCYLQANYYIDNNSGLRSLEKKIIKILARITNSG